LRPHRAPLFLALGLGLLLTAATGRAQVTPSTTPDPSTSKAEDPDTAELNRALAAAAFGEEAARNTLAATSDFAPRPFLRGFNASVSTTSQHDSAGGWQSILTPSLAFRFNRHFSVFAGLPVYSYINIVELISTTPTTPTAPGLAPAPGIAPAPPVPPTPPTYIYGYRKRNFLLGDTNISAQYGTWFRPFGYGLTATLGLPSGDDNNGLGAGQVTWNLNNHFERPLSRRLTPELELGIGNSSNLVDPTVRKTYTDVGANAHFQVGMNLQLRRSISFTSNLFEELPMSTQTFTSTTTNGKKGRELQTFTTISSQSVGEDNGFLNTLDIPLSPHVTLSAFYNRSLRNRIDTAGFSFTFLLKPPRTTETR
jgi:hypothetical protein